MFYHITQEFVVKNVSKDFWLACLLVGNVCKKEGEYFFLIRYIFVG